GADDLQVLSDCGHICLSLFSNLLVERPLLGARRAGQGWAMASTTSVRMLAVASFHLAIWLTWARAAFSARSRVREKPISLLVPLVAAGDPSGRSNAGRVQS